MRYICQICGYIYDEESEGVPFSELPDDWKCPMCKAPRSMFKAEGAEESHDIEPDIIDSDMKRLSPGVLAAVFSNLRRGAEKQYLEKEPELFRRLSEYFSSAVAHITEADAERFKQLSDDMLLLYQSAKKTASAENDRGALRACTWAEKVEMIINALIARYRDEGEAFLENTEVWVCSICGFVYIGDKPPMLCPVCKVPEWKFERIAL